jgi:DNA polymerase I-like protein with 3'-5' exonuclease and polymerase domains
MNFPYEFIESTEGLLKVLQRLSQALVIAIDTETTVIDSRLMDHGHVGAWAVTSIAARYADGSEELTVVDMTNIDCNMVAFGFSKITAYAWNANFECKVFEGNGIRIGKWLDLMLYQAVLDMGTYQGYTFYMGLAECAHKRLNIDLEGKKTIQMSFAPGTVLTDEQKAYAGQDAIVTLWLYDPIVADLEEAGLLATAIRECGAMRFISQMNEVGLPFDVEGWRNHLVNTQANADEAMVRLADLTGGSERNLFGSTGLPTWKIDSKPDLIKVFNTYEPARVKKYLSTWGKRDRKNASEFSFVDAIDKPVLQLMGGDIANALLEVKAAEKTLSTYGEDMLALLGDDGRFHSRYLQALAATGRLTCDKPNAQNMTPKSKKYTKPLKEGRVFVAADFSQAELRLLAQVTGDQAMMDAFLAGLDLHVVTASRMFNVDVAAMEDADPPQYSALRGKAKTLNFGIVYGLGAAKLAEKLTIGGVETTPNEAKGLLKRYLEVYPGVRTWLEARDNYIMSLSENPGTVDWANTWDLFRAYNLYIGAFFRLKKQGAVLSDENIARATIGPSRSENAADLKASTEECRWALSFRGPVILKNRTTPWSFESRTPGGRRRLFHISVDEWLTSMMLVAASSRKDEPRRITEEWCALNGVKLTNASGQPLGWGALIKAFEKKTRKADYVKTVIDAMPGAAEKLMTAALSDCIRSKKNQFRNHPIQGGVGDAVLEAFELIDLYLRAFTDAVPIQSVHDSIVVECNEQDAEEVRKVLVAAMMEAMTRYVYDIPAKVDADVQRSLDGKIDKIDLALMEELFEFA